MEVFFYEAFEEEEAAIRGVLPSRIEAGFTWKTIQESGDRQPPAGVISVRTQSVLPPEWAEDVRGVISRSTGTDHIQQWREASGRVVPTCYLPTYCARAVAEQAMLLWMALLRKLPKQTAQFRRFHRDGITGSECRHKRLLVVGVGNIGSEVVRIGKGLDMEVRGVDLDPRHHFVEYVPIEQGIGWADVLVCAMNLTAANRGYFDIERLREARCGALFINIARGEMSPSADLLQALEEEILAGVGLDVYDQEQALAVALRSDAKTDDPNARTVLALLEREDVIFTPHNAFNTREAVARKASQSVEQLLHFLECGEFLWPVPMP